MLGMFLAIIVAFLWSIGEVNYSKISKKYDKTNVYLYTYFIRSVLYLGIVILFQRKLIGTYNPAVLCNVLPIIFCDLFASLVINIAVYNGKLSVVSPIMAAYPVIDVFLGIILLREKVHVLEIILIIGICLAIVFLAKNQKKTRKAPNPKKGIIFAVFYMLLVAVSTYFEKSIYNHNITVYDLYYYKGMVYFATTVLFGITIGLTPIKQTKPNKDILKGCGLTPIGNIFYSFALSCGSLIIVAPISSLYTVITTYLSKHILKEKIRKREKVCILYILFATILLVILTIVL